MEALEKLPSSRYVDLSFFVKDRVLISPISQRHLTGEFEKKYIGTRSLCSIASRLAIAQLQRFIHISDFSFYFLNQLLSVSKFTPLHSLPTLVLSALTFGIPLVRKSLVVSVMAITFRANVVSSCLMSPLESPTKMSPIGIAISSVFVKTSLSYCAETKLMSR